MLSDSKIRELIESGTVQGFASLDKQLQPCSFDVRLGPALHNPATGVLCDLPMGGVFHIGPGEFILAHTLERVCLPSTIACDIAGKSSWGRRGLAVHVTAGFIDPGFCGQIVLELANLGGPLRLEVGCAIAQLRFYRVEGEVERPYGSEGLGSHYQGQSGVVHSRL